MLLCHDFQGGYGDDALLAGGGPGDAFCFHRWASVDAFCYFSHATATLPPPSWTDAAHAAGVPVYGTLAFEWEEGRAGLLAALAAPGAVARQLARVAAHYGFEGWLLNVEVEFASAASAAETERRAGALAALVAAARAALAAAVPGGWGALTWYDAVTADGRLAWQNGLTRANERFAAAAGRVFLNYGWTRATLAASVAACARLGDALPPGALWCGADVFGRGSHGGGGAAGVRVAAAAAAAAGASLAVFAPGWVHEVGGASGYQDRAQALWDGVDAAFLCARAGALAARARALAALPFHTSFFPGACGDGTDGYSHLGLQERLPAWGCNAAATRAAFERAGGADGPVRLRLSCVEVAVVGVGCGAPEEAGGRGELRVVGAARACAPLPDIPLFDFPVDPLPPAGLRVTVVARRDRGGAAPAIVLVPGDRRAARVAVAPPTSSPPGHWATVSVVVPPADLPGGLASVAVRAGGGGGGAFAGRVASLALADAAWAPPLSPAATSISTTPCDDGDTLTLAWGAPSTGVARWEVWRARAGSPPEWLAAARLPRVALPRQPPGADIIVQAVFGDGGREALGGAARARAA